MQPSTYFLKLIGLMATTQTMESYPDRSCIIPAYTDRTTSKLNPANASDCLSLAAELLNPRTINDGPLIASYKDMEEGYMNKMLYSQCVLAFYRDETEDPNVELEMSKYDAVEIFSEVVKMFAPLHEGKVAANGTIECAGKRTRWVLYGSTEKDGFQKEIDGLFD